MTPLFFSAACDFCDGRATVQYYEGFVVYRGARDGLVHEEYVFRSLRDAKRFRSLRDMDDVEIRRVRSHEPFHWRRSGGSVKGLELADHRYAIFPDHRYEPRPFRAHVG
ncbi:MAG: hypothetical protein OXU20_26595 [Myxococcales bacterium]|nr:hypothetical protein [Myxococcales bacterium]MDD9967798.1 hypothetical protein [Myxococcales bacterium]